MADTRRELSALQTLLADNTAGDISAQDARDALVSESPSFIHPTSAFASPPSTPVTGDLWLPSDGVSAYRYSGSAWVPWGPLFPFAEPSLQTFAWVNQGSGTVSTTNGGIYLSAPSVAGDSIILRKKSAPATPYTITAWFAGIAGRAGTAPGVGLAFRQSSDGKIHAFTMTMQGSGNFGWYSRKYTDATTFSASYTTNATSNVETYAAALGSIRCYRIADNGTNRILSWSVDGQNFQPLHTVGRTDFLTADEVGFFVNPWGDATGLTLLSWKEG